MIQYVGQVVVLHPTVDRYMYTIHLSSALMLTIPTVLLTITSTSTTDLPSFYNSTQPSSATIQQYHGILYRCHGIGYMDTIY